MSLLVFFPGTYQQMEDRVTVMRCGTFDQAYSLPIMNLERSPEVIDSLKLNQKAQSCTFLRQLANSVPLLQNRLQVPTPLPFSCEMGGVMLFVFSFFPGSSGWLVGFRRKTLPFWKLRFPEQGETQTKEEKQRQAQAERQRRRARSQKHREAGTRF